MAFLPIQRIIFSHRRSQRAPSSYNTCVRVPSPVVSEDGRLLSVQFSNQPHCHRRLRGDAKVTYFSDVFLLHVLNLLLKGFRMSDTASALAINEISLAGILSNTRSEMRTITCFIHHEPALNHDTLIKQGIIFGKTAQYGRCTSTSNTIMLDMPFKVLG